MIADLGNCWMERDCEDTVRRAGARIAVVQFSDAVFGTTEQPSPGGRVVPGDGDLALDAFIEAALDAGYTGAFELEVVGPAIEAEGHAAALRRAVDRANDCCTRCSREPGDRLQRRRDLGGARPPGARPRSPVARCCGSRRPACATATSTTSKVACTRPWGGEFPSIAGPRDRRAGSRRITPAAAARVGRRRGRPRRGARHRRRPRDGFRIYGHDFSVDEGSGLYGGFAEHLELLPGSMVYRLRDDRSGRGAHLLRAVELRGDLGAPDPAKATSCVIEGPGHMGMATIVAARAGGRGDGHRHRRLRRTGSASTPRCVSVPIT